MYHAEMQLGHNGNYTQRGCLYLVKKTLLGISGELFMK